MTNKHIGGILWIPLIIFSFFISICLIFMIAPSIGGINCTEKVTAEVIENKPKEFVSHSSKHRNRKSTVYTPVFRFVYNDKEYTVESNTSSDPPDFKVGESVEIKVDPNDPTHICQPMSLLFYLIPGGIIVFLVIIYIVMCIKVKKPAAAYGDGGSYTYGGRDFSDKY